MALFLIFCPLRTAPATISNANSSEALGNLREQFETVCIIAPMTSIVENEQRVGVIVIPQEAK